MLLTIHDLTAQRSMEKALAEAQNLFYGAFHLGPTALSISHLADGTFVDVNEQFLRLSGFKREELIEQRADELNLWHDPEACEAIRQELEEQETLREIEVALRRKSGEICTVLASFQRFEAMGGPFVLTNAIDISKRKRTEEALRKAKEEAEEVAQLRTSLITNITHEFRTAANGYPGLHLDAPEKRRRRVPAVRSPDRAQRTPVAALAGLGAGPGSA